MKEYTLTFTVDITNSFKFADRYVLSKDDFKNCIEAVFASYNFEDYKIKNLKVFEREFNKGEPVVRCKDCY